MVRNRWPTRALALASAAGILLGCGTGGVTGPQASTTAHGMIKTVLGAVRSGALALAGVNVVAYAAGSSGSTATLAQTNSDASGSFQLSVACPPASTGAATVYLVASGGSTTVSEGGPGSSNVAIKLIAALGDCTTIGAATVNELTTVATGYALAQSKLPGSALTPVTGYTAAALAHPFALAIDSSGSLWVTNFGADSVTEFVGIASPVATPLIGVPHSP